LNPPPIAVQFSLVIQTSFLGDVVLTTPLMAELARRGPVHVVATPAGAPLLARNPDIAGCSRCRSIGNKNRKLIILAYF